MKLVTTIALSAFLFVAHSQTYDEWFRQKKTQKEYLLQQIAALQTYIGYAEQGYSIVKSGLNLIGNVKKGDFSLHSDYFKSLANVNPSIKQYVKVAETITLQISIAKQISSTLKACRTGQL